MRRIFAVLIWAALVVAAQTTDTAALDAAIEAARKAYAAPAVVVGIVRGDEVVYLKAHGEKRAGQAATPDTRFAMASTTKAVTATALAILVDDGKLNWDDPVRKHLPGFRLADPLADMNVTVRDLLTHRTGLSRNDALWYNTTWSRDELIRRAGLVPLTRPFRSAYQYNNLMFLTAGEVAGRVAGSTWEQFVTARILEPLGMTNTDFSARDVVRAPDHATPHIKKDGKVVAREWKNFDNIGPAGTMNSSARDLTKWVRMQLAGGKFGGRQVVSAKQIEETRTPQMVVREEGPSRELNPDTNISVYGLGWRMQDYRGRHLISHGGAIDGFRSQVALLPKENYGMVILANLGGNNLPEALRNMLTDVLLGLEKRDWLKLYLETEQKQQEEAKARLKEREAKRAKETRPSHPLADYAGSFEHPAYGAARISVEAGGLLLEWGAVRTPIAHFHYDTFQAPADGGPFENQQVVFRLAADGTVAGLQFLEQEFRRPAPAR